MAARKVKEENDKLTDLNIAHVIGMLNPTEQGVKPWTKKDCCAFLGIAYNTSRLDSLIKSYIDKVEYEAAKRKERRGKPLTYDDIKYILQAYIIDNEPMETIAKSIYRSASTVKKTIVNCGVPMRPISHDYFNPTLIPEESMREQFAIGEIVYSSKYNCNAIVKAEFADPVHAFVYRIWLLGDYQQFAYTPVYELASLNVLREYGVVVNG